MPLLRQYDLFNYCLWLFLYVCYALRRCLFLDAFNLRDCVVDASSTLYEARLVGNSLEMSNEVSLH